MNQIISHDCMWSGTCGDKSHPGKPPRAIAQPIQNGNCTTNGTDDNNSSNSKTSSSTTGAASVAVNSCKANSNSSTHSSSGKIQISSGHSSSGSNHNSAVKTMAIKVNQIAAGQSLLLSRNKNGTQLVPQIATSNGKSMPSRISSTNGCDRNNSSGTATRPDTPLSLDDDSPEFKHNLDLAGTIDGAVYGNGYGRRREDSQTIIDKLKATLEDDVQGLQQFRDIFSSTFGAIDNPEENVLDLLQCLSDFEAQDDEMTSDADSDSEESNYSSSGYNNQSQQSPATVASYDYHHHHQTETSFGDHSYTRPKTLFDTRDLGVQTPSDSGKLPFHLSFNLYFYT